MSVRNAGRILAEFGKNDIEALLGVFGEILAIIEDEIEEDSLELDKLSALRDHLEDAEAEIQDII